MPDTAARRRSPKQPEGWWMLIERVAGEPPRYLNGDFKFVGPEGHCATHRFESREAAITIGREIKIRPNATLYVQRFGDSSAEAT